MAQHMPDTLRRKYAQMYVRLIRKGMTRKQAMLRVRDTIRELNPLYACSRVQIYVWCKRFGLSTR